MERGPVIKKNRPKINKDGVRVLQEALGLCPSRDTLNFPGACPAVLVAIDFEKLDNLKEERQLDIENQVDLAIFDLANFDQQKRNGSTSDPRREAYIII